MSFWTKKNKVLAAGLLAFLLSGTVWAQTISSPVYAWNFSAVQTSSVESRSSFGFGSLVDDYINVTRWSSHDFKTFAFLGGGWAPSSAGKGISLGYGTVLGSNHLSVYYAGSLADVSGAKTDNSSQWKPNNDSKIYDTAESSANWDSKLALLYGAGNMGLRLDLVLGHTNRRITRDGQLEYLATNGLSSMAAALGIKNSNMDLWAQVGFKFPQTEVITNAGYVPPTNTPTPTMFLTRSRLIRRTRCLPSTAAQA